MNIEKTKKECKIMKNFRIAPELYRGLEDLANVQGMTQISILERALFNYIKKQESFTGTILEPNYVRG